MNDSRNNVNKKYVKTFIFLLILIIIILLLIKACPSFKLNNEGIKIIDIKQKVDSFSDDEIYIKNLKKNHTYNYDITIHNYLDEDYYLYKVEVDNKNLSYNDLLKLLKHGKDTTVKLNLKSTKNIKDKTRIKFYYGKLKEIYIGDEVLSVFGDEKVKLPEGTEKDGYKFLGYSDKKGTNKAKYKANKEYNLKDGTKLYPVYEKINPETGDNKNNEQTNNNNQENDNNNQGNNNNQENNNDKKEEKKENARFIVTFDYQNGTESTTKEVINTEKYGTLPTAVKTGYYFIGWYLGSQKITSESIVNLTSNVTLVAKYNLINYSIYYNLDGGTTSNPSSYTVESNDIVLSDAQKDGYTFLGWTGTNGEVPEKNVIISKGSTGNKSYTANYSAHEEVNYKVIHKKQQLDGTYSTFEEETYSAPYGSIVKPSTKTYEGFNSPEQETITIKQDGTSKVEYKYDRKNYKYTLEDSEDVISSLPSGNYPYETEITLTAKEKEGYDFEEWSNGENDNPTTISLTDNITIKPIYTPKTYVVEFNSNTGVGEMPNQSFTYDEEKSLTKNTFTKIGNKFIGWNTKADGSGVAYLDEQVVKNLASSRAVTLYAQFIEETYTISFNTDGGEELFSIERTYGETYGNLPEAIKTGYTFIGWYLGDQKIESNTVVDVTSDTTLKAKYNIINYNITYTLDGGETSNPATYTVEDEIVLNNPTKIGYTFSGWTGSNGNSLQTLVTISKGSTGEKTYTAHYSTNTNTKYIVKHKKQKLTLDGYELEETENLYGASDTKVTPEVKTYEGFTSPAPQEITIRADGTTELEYEYDRKKYTYTVVDQDNMTSSLPSGDYPYGTEVTVTANSVPGYTFDSWNNGETDNPATFNIDSDLDIEPIYKANNYYVVFNNNTGTGSMENQKMTYNSDEVLNKSTLTKQGYNFKNWNTRANGTGTSYEDEATVKNLAQSGYFILYALWEAKSDTAYKVITRKQNIDLVTYTETENTYYGTTDTEVTPVVVDYTGFVSPNSQTITITADGNASVTYTYDREMYEFNLPDTDNVITSKGSGEYPYGTEIELKAKDIPGYTFDGWSDGVNDNPRVITLDQDVTITPTYKANTDTSYTVNHYKQNLTLDGYDLEKTENLKGTTDSKVTPQVKEYEGFTAPVPVEVTIKGDGTAVVNYNYDRVMYAYTVADQENMTSSLPSGDYPYGTEVTVSANSVPGYTFSGWSDGNNDNPRTIIIKDNISIEPTYVANTNTSYTVNHYKQNLTLDGYELEETENLKGTTDTKVTPQVKDYTGFTAPVPVEVTIKGDGTTVVTYNYDRKIYNYTVAETENMISSLPSGDYPYGTEITVEANNVPGYTFDGWNDGVDENPRVITLDKNVSIEPIYSANTNTSYKVEHYKQKVTQDGYDLAETDNLTGTTDTKVTPNVKTYIGFNSPVPTEVTIKGDGSTIVTYNYTRKSYTFTINDSEDVISSHPSGSYPYGTEIELTAKDKEGYTFVGWSNGDTNQTTIISLTDNIEVSPVYSSNTDTAYKVIHRQMNIDGEGYTTYETEILYGTTGSKVTPEVHTYTGFTSPEPEKITITGDGKASVTYNYTRNKYDFAVTDRTYIDESTSTKNGKYYYQTEISITAKNREGYTFAGWSNGDNTITTSFGLDDDTTISPIYTANKYNVVYNSNTGSGIMTDQEMTYNTKAKLSKNLFVKAGYTFAGWNRDPEGIGSTYADEEEVENLVSSGNVILYAQWVANLDTPYTVIHKKQNLDMESYTEIEENYTAPTNQEITPEVHTYTGFVSPQSQTVTIAGDGSTVVTYIYAREMYEFTISNKEDVVSSHEEGSYPYETIITLRAKEKVGYTFTKWSDDVTTNPRKLILTENTSISPIYEEKEDIPYKVIHRKQNVDMETYTDIEEEFTGYIDQEITPEVHTYNGFTSPEPQTTTISGDGTTVVTYIYTRKMYEFNLSDTDNVISSHESGEYPYETEISLTAKSKPGYTFTNWSTGELGNPLLILLSNDIEIYPIYTANTNTEYKVIHRKQKVTLDGYDIEEEIIDNGTTDTEVTPVVKTYEGFVSPQSQTVTIAGDGSTVVTYDYDRLSYSLTYEDTTYIDNDKSTPAGNYPYGYQINIKAMDRAGYTFDGWSNGLTSNPLVISLSNNVSIKPLYIPNTNTYYKIIYRKQNLDLISYTDEIEERFGTTDTEVTPVVKAYEGFNSPEPQTAIINGDQSTEVIYEYTRKMYSLSFNNNENVITDTPEGNYPYASEITVKAAKRVGNKFVGWNNGKEDVSYTFRLYNDTTIYPMYISNKITVSFEPNGGTGSMPDQEIYKNEKTKISANTFTRDNYCFLNWNTKADGTGEDYLDSEEIERNEDLILYAQWISSDKVARIGKTYYTSITNAVNAVPATGEETEIVVLKDTTETFEIPQGKNVVLNLQNFTLRDNWDSSTIINNGTLRFVSGTISSTAYSGAIRNNSTGILIIDGGKIQSSSSQAIYNNGGNLTIKGDSYIYSDYYYATIHNINEGNINILDGTIISTYSYAIYNEDGTLNIGKKDGIVSQNSPEIRGYYYGVIANSKYNFYDGIIEGTYYHTGIASTIGEYPDTENDINETKINEIEDDSTKVIESKYIDYSTYSTLTLKNSDDPIPPEPTPGPVIYTIKFDAQGGHTSELKRKVEKNTELGELPTFSRDGYIAKGWYTKKSGGEEVTSETIASRSTTYYAQYISTIDQAIFSPIRIAMHIGDSRTISVTKPTDIEEFTFDSNDDSIATVNTLGKVTGISEGITTITVTGKISGITKTIDVEVIPPKKYRVKFNSNGGKATDEERFVNEGGIIGELPDATKEELVLDGWYTGLIDGYKVTSNYIINHDVELFAKYKERITMFVSGKDFNGKLKKLAGNDISDYSPYLITDTNIKSIVRSSTAPDLSQMTEDNIISIEESKTIIYAWFDQGNIYWWTESEEVYFNDDSSYMYSNFRGLELLDFETINSSRIVNMSYMFSNLVSLSDIDFSLLDTSNVTDMSNMFLYSEFEELNITKLDTSNVRNMSSMFLSTKVPSLDFSKSDLRNVENMSSMFINANISSIDFTNIETNSLTNINSMFAGTKIKELDLSDFDTSKINQMSSIFGGTSELKKLDMSNWDFSSMTSLSGFFATGMTGLEEIKLDNVNTSTITNFSGLFSGSSSLVNVDLSDFDTSNMTEMGSMFGGCNNLTKVDMSNWDFSKTNSSGLTNILSLSYNDSLQELTLDNSILPANMSYGFTSLTNLKKLSLNNVDTSNVTNMSNMFSYLTNVLELDLSSFDTSNVTNMSNMFQSLSTIAELDLRSFDTSNVTNMSSMFSSLEDLNTIYATELFVTDKITSSSVFYNVPKLVGGMGTKFHPSNNGKQYAHIDKGEDNPGYFTETKKEKYTITFNANGGNVTPETKKINIGSEIGVLPKATNGNHVFLGWFTGLIDGIEIDQFTIPNSDTVYYARWSEPIAEFDKGKIVNTKFKTLSGTSSASYSSTNQNITDIVRSDVQPDISSMTEKNIVSSSDSALPIYAWFDDGKIYWWSESSVVYLNNDSSYLFSYFKELKNIEPSDYNTSNVEYMNYMFNNCSKIELLDLSTWNTKNLMAMQQMFSYCSSLTELNLSSFDTRNVRSLYMTFYYCTSLIELDLSSFDTRNVTNMYMTFYYCSSLTSLNVRSFDTRNVTNMYLTFYGLSSLTKLDLSSFNTQYVLDMTQIYGSCANLEELNIENFDFSLQSSGNIYNYASGSTQKLKKINAANVKFGVSMYMQFSGLASLEELDLSNADTSNVTNMGNLFYGCSSLKTLDLTSFDTSNVTDMSLMFYDCPLLSDLDISSFDTKNVTYMSVMFYNCSSLESLDLSHFDISNLSSPGSMFSGCTSLESLNISNWDFVKFNASSFSSSTSLYSTPIKLIIMDNAKLYNSISYMFGGLRNLEQVSLNNIDTTNVTGMSNLFNGDINLSTLDLRSFNTKNVTSMNSMFYGMTNLETIIVSDNFVTDKVVDSDYMFKDDTSLVGGSGTVFDPDHVDKEYARYDGGEHKPGYFNSFDYSGKYEITYNNDGRIFTRYINAGDPIDFLPDGDKTGYTLEGWYLNNVKITESYVPTSDITLVANYDINEYTITFESKGGSEVNPIYKEYNSEIGDLPVPEKAGFRLVGWFDSESYIRLVSPTTKVVEDITLYAKWEEVNSSSLTYDAGEGSFIDGKTRTINYEYPGSGLVRRVVHTSNINDDGDARSVYSNNLSQNHVVSISGAKKIRIEVWFTTESTSYDWLAIYPSGITPSKTNYNSATISGGKLGGHGSYTGYTKPSNQDKTYHKVYEVNGNTAQFYFTSDSGGAYYGFYAIVTGISYTSDIDYEIPQANNKFFVGWNTESDGTGDAYLNELELFSNINSLSGKTLYAQYIDAYSTFIDGKELNIRMKKLSGSSNPTYTTTNSNIYGFVRSDTMPSIEMTEDNIVSTPDSISPIYMWYENNTIRYYVNSDRVYLNSDSSYLFNNMTLLNNFDFSEINTSKVQDFSYFFSYCRKLTNIDLSSFDTSSAINLSYMFYYCTSLETIDLSSLDVSKVENMAGLFSYCSSLTSVDLNSLNTQNVIYIYSMFYKCTSLETIDLSSLDLSNVESMNSLFYNCTSLTSVDLSSLNTQNVKEMSSLFSNCSSITNINLSSLDTSKVTSMSSMFQNCTSLETIDLSSFDVRNVTSMSSMFQNCSSLKEIDMFNFKTTSLTNISSMFQNCKNLIEVDLSHFDTSKVTQMNSMFQNCTSLKELDLNSFNTTSVSYMYSMFEGCSSLQELDLSTFNTTSATNMASMFTGCKNLTELDLSSFDTSKVTNMNSMFANCTSIQEIDITGFKTTVLSSANNMFANCIDLRTIYSDASITFSAVTNANDMFTSDNLLVGGRGTTYSSSNIDKEYAHLDSGSSNPGYFSQRMGIIITFDMNDGITSPTMKTINVGAQIGNLPYPSREGATFEGWYDDLEFTNKIQSTTKFFNDATVYAKWNINKYTVTFDSQGGTSVDSIEREHGEYVGELPVTSNENKNFVGWFTSSDDLVHEETKVKSDITYYAKWSDVEEGYIKYNGNGGLFGEDDEISINYSLIQKGVMKVSHTSNINDSGVATSVYDDNLSTNNVVTIPHATRIRIEVWFSTQSSSYDWLAIYPKGITPTSSNYSSATISNGRLGGHGSYGGYTQPKDTDSTYHKVYYVNGDTAQFYFNSDSSSAFYGYYAIVTGIETMVERDISYSEPYYKYKDFIGWNTKQDGTGTSYLDEYSVISNFDSLKEKTLYAQWIIAESTFKASPNFQESIRKLTNSSTNNFKHFKRNETKPDLSSDIKTEIISTSDSISPIYAWFIEDTVYWYSSAEHPQMNASCGYMFNYSYLQTIDLSTVKSDYVTNMSGLFDYLPDLISIDISNFTTQNVTNMSNMFSGDKKLVNVNLGIFDTSKVTNMSNMFNNCNSLTSLDLSSFNTENVEDMQYMFSNCNSLEELNISNFDVSKVTNMKYMFSNCNSLTLLDLSSFNTENVEDMKYMFNNCMALTTVDGNMLDLESVTSIERMFYNCNSLVNLNIILTNAKELKYMTYAFGECSSLVEVNLEFLDTNKLSGISYLFYNCVNLKTADISSLGYDSNSYSSSGVFYGCTSLESINISNIDLNKISLSLSQSTLLKTIIANNVKFGANVSGLFNNLQSLEYIELNNADTSLLTNTSSMFSGDTNLKKIYMDNFNSINVTTMSYMFSNCSSLISLDLSSFVTDNVTNMSGMFSECTSLQYLDLNSFNTTNVTTMSYMFRGCGAKVIDIYSFDTSNVTNMDYMFNYCNNLITVYASTKWNTTLAKSKNHVEKILNGSSKIVGKNGSTWSNCNISPSDSDASPYARLDGSSRGFFTEKNGWTLINRAYLGIPIKPSEFLDEQQWSYFEDGEPIHSGFRMLKNLKNVEQKFYFENDIAHTGWLDYEGDMYYFSKSDDNNNGYTDSWAYRSVTKTIDGKSYTFDSEGRVINYLRETYNITFNSNEGTPSTTTKKVVKGEKIGNLPIVLKNGKKLNGWFTGIDSGTKITEDTIPNGDLTYYAHWIDDYGILDTGRNLNVKFKKLARNTSVSYTTKDLQVYYFTRSKIKPEFDFTEKNVISSSNSPVKIYAWFKNNTIYWWSDSNKIKLNEDSSYMFYEFDNIKEIDTSGFDTSSVTNMSYMFYNCYNLEVLDTSKFNTSNVTNMSYMFYYNNDLGMLDVSGFDTSSVTNMSYMFYHCSTIDVLNTSGFNTSNVTNMSYMFYYCFNIKSLDVDEFDTSNVTNMSNMFYDCSKVTDLDISNFNTSEVTDMSSMFGYVHTPNLDFSRWDTSKVTNMSGMFNSYKYELDLSPFVTDNVTNMSRMFIYYGFDSLDLSMFNTSRVTNMSSMFAYSKATSINYSSFNTSNVTNMSGLFSNCSLPSIDIRHFNTSNVTNMSYMFNKTLINNIDLSNFNTSRVTNMSYMFSESALNNIDLSLFDTRRVTNMEYMFSSCKNLTRLDVRSFNSSNLNKSRYMFAYSSNITEILFGNNFTAYYVTEMTSMFSGCSSLKELDLSMFNTVNVTEMASMFNECKSLVSLDISNLKTSRVTYMSYMFNNCENLLNINLSSFNTANVKYMSYMFSNCSKIKILDLTSFNTINVINMEYLFSGMSNLNTIYVSSNYSINSVNSSYNMFKDCINIVGEKGTTYDSTKTNLAYAHIDGGTSNPGYFSQLSSPISLTFDPNGGTGSMSNQKISSNKDNILYKNSYNMKYHELASWNTMPDGTGTSYPDEGLIPANTFTTDTTLYAQWRLNGWVLINEDQVQPPEDHLEEQLWSYYAHGELLDNGLFILKNFYNEDKIYYIQNGVAQLGWHKVNGNWYYFSKNDSDENSYINCDAYENGKYLIDDDIYTFDENGVCLDYAESPLTTYRVILDSNGGGYVRNLIVNRGSGLTNIPTPIAPIGKTFEGWYTDITGGIKVEEGYVPSGNITIYARYSNIDYTVSFDSREGSSVNSRYKHYGDEIGSLPTTNRQGYNFVGWYTDTTFKTKITSDTKIIDNVTFYARWSKVISNTCSDNQNITTSSGAICKRATKLHQEECKNNAACSRYYYPESSRGTTTITYGNCGDSGVLNAGDAFDCDVNGDGIYDSQKERFYYVSNFYDTNKKKVDYNTAVLIYYSNYANGQPSNDNSYAFGRYTVINYLPSTDNWSNVSLKNTVRKTVDNNGKSSSSNISVDYTGHSARLLTAVEYLENCSTHYYSYSTCEFFLENSIYSITDNNQNGFWLEGYASEGNYNTSGYYYASITTNYSYRGIRPVIDVDKKKISYGAEYVNIVYDSNGGTGTTSSQNINKYEKFTLSESGYSKKNHRFAGWNTKADGSGNSFTDEQLVEGNTFTSDVTLYAQWIKVGWEFENESTWDSSQPLTGQKWAFYQEGNKISNGLIEVKSFDEDNKYNYYIKDGYLYYGWLQMNDNWYFFSWFDNDESGHIDGYMLRDVSMEIDGVEYVFDNKGICQNPPLETESTESINLPTDSTPIDDNSDNNSNDNSVVNDDSNSDTNIINPSESTDSMNPNASSNVGSSVFGLLYKHDLKHNSLGIILAISFSVLSTLFIIYKVIKNKKRISS